MELNIERTHDQDNPKALNSELVLRLTHFLLLKKQLHFCDVSFCDVDSFNALFWCLPLQFRQYILSLKPFSRKIQDFGPKNGQICLNYGFLVILGLISTFLDHLVPCLTKTRCQCGFSVMWVPKLLLPPVKIRIFAQKRPYLAQNWHFWSIWARPCRLIQCPVVGRLVVVARGLYLARHLFTLWDFSKHIIDCFQSRWLDSCMWWTWA